MENLRKFEQDQLEWTRAGGPGTYQLTDGHRTFATLTWDKGPGFPAAAAWSGGTWQLRHRGFLVPSITVRDQPTDQEAATLRAHWPESVVRLPDGTVFRWTCTGFWNPTWKVVDPAGEPLLSFEPRPVHGRLDRGLVSWTPAGGQHPAFPLLLVLGWYFIMLVWEEQEGDITGALVATLVRR